MSQDLPGSPPLSKRQKKSILEAVQSSHSSDVPSSAQSPATRPYDMRSLFSQTSAASSARPYNALPLFASAMHQRSKVEQASPGQIESVTDQSEITPHHEGGATTSTETSGSPSYIAQPFSAGPSLSDIARTLHGPFSFTTAPSIVPLPPQLHGYRTRPVEMPSKVVSFKTGDELEWSKFIPCPSRHEFSALASTTSSLPHPEQFEEFSPPPSPLRPWSEDTLLDSVCMEAPLLTNKPSFPESSSSQSASSPSFTPLYANSPFSVQDALVTLITFAQSIHLSGQDFNKLLELMDTILPQPNNLPKSSTKLFQCFEQDTSELHIFYFCNICWKQRTSLKDICANCPKPGKKVVYFLVCPLEQQLRKLCSRPGFKEKLDYKNTRQKFKDDNIEDIYDGTVYQRAQETVLQDSANISLTWYTDGVSLYECSAYSLWPFLFIINELSPEERYKPENIIVGGYWGCSEKPHPNFFLLPIYQEIVKLSNGVQVKFENSEEESTVKVYILSGRCDAVAKSSFMNMKGHSGYYACPKCLIEGEKSNRTGNVMVFPHKDNLDLRNDVNYQDCVLRGVALKDGYQGVYGPTILSYMTNSDFISSLSIDSMHCIYLGVTKYMINLWFNSSYSAKEFSLSQKIQVVNERLTGLQLPHFVQRFPLGVDKLAYWKASLLRNFLLYFCLVVFKDVMKDEYYEHLALLVDGIALLNSSSISQADLLEADRLLCKFSRDFQRLYGVRYMTYNLHMTRHLSQAVSESGNLFHNTCFELEDLNGKMSKLVHGTTHASLQIHSRFTLLSELNSMISNIKSDDLKKFCTRLTGYGRTLNLSEKISEGTYVVGGFSFDLQYKECIAEMLSEIFMNPPLFQTFHRLFRNKVLYTSCSYVGGARLSSYCKYKRGSETVYGKILTFVKTSGAVGYFALISQSTCISTEIRRYLEDSGVDNTVDFVSVNNLVCVCFCLCVDGRNFVVEPMNIHEME